MYKTHVYLIIIQRWYSGWRGQCQSKTEPSATRRLCEVKLSEKNFLPEEVKDWITQKKHHLSRFFHTDVTLTSLSSVVQILSIVGEKYLRESHEDSQGDNTTFVTINHTQILRVNLSQKVFKRNPYQCPGNFSTNFLKTLNYHIIFLFEKTPQSVTFSINILTPLGLWE